MKGENKPFYYGYSINNQPNNCITRNKTAGRAVHEAKRQPDGVMDNAILRGPRGRTDYEIKSQFYKFMEDLQCQ